jgi:hypothetical protein
MPQCGTSLPPLYFTLHLRRIVKGGGEIPRKNLTKVNKKFSLNAVPVGVGQIQVLKQGEKRTTKGVV